jgi:GTP-binding protein EngB required for normal cell division
VSDRPGETRAIDFYSLSDHASRVAPGNGVHASALLLPRFVDLPGYGFAFADEVRQMQWKELITQYFQERQALSLACVVVDARHGLKPSDRATLEQLDARRQGSRALTESGCGRTTSREKRRNRLAVDVLVIMTKSDLVEQASFLV